MSKGASSELENLIDEVVSRLKRDREGVKEGDPADFWRDSGDFSVGYDDSPALSHRLFEEDMGGVSKQDLVEALSTAKQAKQDLVDVLATALTSARSSMSSRSSMSLGKKASNQLLGSGSGRAMHEGSVSHSVAVEEPASRSDEDKGGTAGPVPKETAGAEEQEKAAGGGRPGKGKTSVRRHLSRAQSDDSSDEDLLKIVDVDALHKLLCKGTVKEAERAVEMLLDSCDEVNGSYRTDTDQVAKNRQDAGDIKDVWCGLLKVLREGTAVGRGGGKAAACHALGYICYNDMQNCDAASSNGELLLELAHLVEGGHGLEKEAAAGAISNMCTAWSAFDAKVNIASCKQLIMSLCALCDDAAEKLNSKGCDCSENGGGGDAHDSSDSQPSCQVCAGNRKIVLLALRAAGAFLNITAYTEARNVLDDVANEEHILSSLERLASLNSAYDHAIPEIKALMARATMTIANMRGRKETANVFDAFDTISTVFQYALGSEIGEEACLYGGVLWKLSAITPSVYQLSIADSHKMKLCTSGIAHCLMHYLAIWTPRKGTRDLELILLTVEQILFEDECLIFLATFLAGDSKFHHITGLEALKKLRFIMLIKPTSELMNPGSSFEKETPLHTIARTILSSLKRPMSELINWEETKSVSIVSGSSNRLPIVMSPCMSPRGDLSPTGMAKHRRMSVLHTGGGDLVERSDSRAASRTSSAGSDGESRNGRWVMISYNWDVQSFAKKLCFALQASNFKVWMDILDGCMGGDTLDAMAQAVSQASVVMCIVTQKYKESANCRREVSYAHDLDKPIIPIIVDDDYFPGAHWGWLGLIIAGKMWYNFANQEFSKTFGELMKAPEMSLVAKNFSSVERSSSGGKISDISRRTASPAHKPAGASVARSQNSFQDNTFTASFTLKRGGSADSPRSIAVTDRRMSGILVRRYSIDNHADSDQVKIDDDFFTDERRQAGEENEEAGGGGEKDQDEATHSSTGSSAEPDGRRANIENWRRVDSFRSSDGSIRQGMGSKGGTPGTTGPPSPAFASPSDKNGGRSSEFEGKPHSSQLLEQGDGVNLEVTGLTPRDVRGIRNVKNPHASFDSNHSGRRSNVDGMPTIYSGHNTPTTALVQESQSAVEEEEEEEEGNKNKSKKKPPTINVGEATIRRMSRTESAAVHCRTVSELSETDGSSKGFPGGNSSSGEGSPIADHVTGQYESNRALSSPNSSAVGTFDLFVSNNVGDVRPARGNLISPRLKGLSFSSTTSLPGADSGTPSMGPATEVDEWLGCIGNGMAQYSLIFRRNAIETLDLLVELTDEDIKAEIEPNIRVLGHKVMFRRALALLRESFSDRKCPVAYV